MLETQMSNNRLLLALCLSSFLGALNFLAATPFFPEMSDDLDVSVSVLGQGITLMIFVSAFLGIAIGPIADRYGYRRPLIIGVGSVAAYLCGIGLAPSYPYLLGMSLFGALGDALTFGVPLAIAGSLYTGAARKRAISWIIGALSCGGIVAVPFLTFVGSVSSWRVALILSGVATIGITLFVSRTVADDRKSGNGSWDLALFRSAYTPVLRHKPTLRLLGSSAARAACWFGFLTYLGAFLSDELGLSTRQIGLVYTVGGAGYLTGSMVAERVLGLPWLRWLIAAMCLITALSTVGIALVDDPRIAVGLIVVLAMASSIAGIGVIYLLSDESPAESATTMLLNGSLLNLGGAGGAALGGIALALGGYLAVGIALSGFALVGAVLILMGRQSSTGAPPVTEAFLQAVRPVGAPVDVLAQIADET
jgi:predicted MFS family arabinose efflux permease